MNSVVVAGEYGERESEEHARLVIARICLYLILISLECDRRRLASVLAISAPGVLFGTHHGPLRRVAVEGVGALGEKDSVLRAVEHPSEVVVRRDAREHCGSADLIGARLKLSPSCSKISALQLDHY